MYFYEFHPKEKGNTLDRRICIVDMNLKNHKERAWWLRTRKIMFLCHSPSWGWSHLRMGQFLRKRIVKQIWLMIDWLSSFFLSIHPYPKRCPLQRTCSNLNFYFWNTYNTLNDLQAQIWKTVLNANSLKQWRKECIQNIYPTIPYQFKFICHQEQDLSVMKMFHRV